MTFSITPSEFERLDTELLDSHQVTLTSATDASTGVTTGTMATLDGKIAASFTFTPPANSLDVELTKHDGYLKFVAESGLKSKLNTAITAIRSTPA